MLVSVNQTTRKRINYFYVSEAISVIEHRAPTYQFQRAIISFAAYCSHRPGVATVAKQKLKHF